MLNAQICPDRPVDLRVWSCFPAPDGRWGPLEDQRRPEVGRLPRLPQLTVSIALIWLLANRPDHPTPPQFGIDETESKRREFEAQARLYDTLNQYWPTVDSCGRRPRDLVPAFCRYAEGVFDARAESLLRTRLSREEYLERIKSALIREVIRQLIPAEGLMVPESEPTDVRGGESSEDAFKRNVWGRIIKLDQEVELFYERVSDAQRWERSLGRAAEARILELAENPSGDWERAIALTFRAFKLPSPGLTHWTDAHPFQLALRLRENRESFIQFLEAKLRIRLQPWKVRFVAVTQPAAAVERPKKDAYDFVERRLSELGMNWKEFGSHLEVSPRTLANIKLDLHHDFVLSKYLGKLARTLQLKDADLKVHVEPRSNRCDTDSGNRKRTSSPRRT